MFLNNRLILTSIKQRRTNLLMRERIWPNLRYKHTSIAHFLGIRHLQSFQKKVDFALGDCVLATMVETKKSAPIMGGLSLSSLKKNYPLIPLFVAVGLAVTGATLYTLRLALRSPDVTWSLKKNPEPWQEYSEKQYKFYSTADSPPKSPAPKY